MRNYWLSQDLFRLNVSVALPLFRAATEHGERLFEKGTRKPETVQVGTTQLILVALRERNAVALLACEGPELEFGSGEYRRAIYLSGGLVESILDDQLSEALVTRLMDASNVDEAKARTGLKYVQQGEVRSIFVAGSYRRLNFACPAPDLTMGLEIVDAAIWAAHGVSATKVHQPSAADLAHARKVHGDARTFGVGLKRPRTADTPAHVPGPLADGWVTLNRLRELGITGEATQRRVLAVKTAEALYDLAGDVPDKAIENLEVHFRLKETRRAEKKVDLVDILNVGTVRPRPDRPSSFDDAVEMLTKHQRDVVTLDRPAPIRLKGGPGTGKTFTAVLRAGFLLREAEKEGRPLRIGFFVFNRDLGEKVVEDLKILGLDSYLEGTSSTPQRLLVASLFDWGERFLKLDDLGVEPLAPYRADSVDKTRLAALQLAVEEARRTLSGPEYDSLWQIFDTKSRHELREIEMEISQFIKARELTELNSYLAERRPPNWWLSSTEQSFKKFVWEIYKVYEKTLMALGFIDADDVINDCLKEVSKNTWQQYKRPHDGFDFLIVDEAQDFFRNQLTLATHLVKDPTGLMLCYDEAQAVYSRYPNLRDLGFDSGTDFFGRNLETNFRSTKQIIRAVKSLFAQYPAATLQASWGDYEAGTDNKSGPRPIAAGFDAEATMLLQLSDILRQAQQDKQSCAVICFDDALRQRTVKSLRDAQYTVDELTSGRRSRATKAVFVTDAKRAKGQQFDVCVLLGVGRDQVPDFSNLRTELQRAGRQDDALREFIVAMSRARMALHFLWAAPAPSKFITSMGEAVDLKA